MSKINAPRGTADTLPAESWKWQAVEAIARDVAGIYHFAEIRTPIYEHSDLFHRGVGETTRHRQQGNFHFRRPRRRFHHPPPRGNRRRRPGHHRKQPGRPGRLEAEAFLHRPQFSLRTPAKGPPPPTPPVRRRGLRRRRAGAGCRVHSAAIGFLPPLRIERFRPANQQSRATAESKQQFAQHVVDS